MQNNREPRRIGPVYKAVIGFALFGAFCGFGDSIRNYYKYNEIDYTQTLNGCNLLLGSAALFDMLYRKNGRQA